MKYMLAVFSVLLLVTVSLAQQQGQQLPNSPPYGTTPPTFPGSPQQPPSQMPPDQKAPPPRSMTTNEVEQQVQAHLNSEPALSNTRLDVIADDASLKPNCVIILFTMFASKQLRALAKTAGVAEVVSKDVGGIRALVEAIERFSKAA